MFRIGEFSKLALVSVKTLRFYDEIDLFKPYYVEENGYRYYAEADLVKISTITQLRQIGLPISEIKRVLNGEDIKNVLTNRASEIEKEIGQSKDSLTLIKNIIVKIEKGEFMKNYEVKEKVLPEVIVYYRHGIIKSMANMVDFILQAGAECSENNPNLKCTGYCYITYEAEEYQEENVELEYLEAVEKVGNESANIKFKTVPSTKAVCVKHIGSYSKLPEAYAYAINYVKQNNLQITDKIREVYIHGCWDCENEADYVTEIQIPIK